MKVVWKGDLHLPVKEKFKRMIECDNFDKIRQMFVWIWIQNWGVRVDKTRNSSRGWNLLVDAHIFRVCNFRETWGFLRKNRQNSSFVRIWIQNRGVRADKTRNRSRGWNPLVDAHIFRVCNFWETRVFLRKIWQNSSTFVRIWIQNRGVRADKTRNRSRGWNH